MIRAMLLSLLLPLSLLAGPVMEYPLEIKVLSQNRDEYYSVLPRKTDARSITYIGLGAIVPFPSEELRNTHKMVVLVKAGQVGRFRFAAIGTLNDEQTKVEFDLVVIGQEPGPTPVPPPIPPTPDPKPPTPVPPTPTPTPTPTPAPIPDAGLRVLITYETGAALPRGQQAILFGKAVREMLDAKCVAGPKQPEYRIYDKDVKGVENDSQLWATAFKRTSGKPVPWLIISNGRTGYEGPLPKDAGEFLKLLEQYEGK